MNLILLQPHEPRDKLPVNDPRGEHLLTVLKIQPGNTFYVGIANGQRGLARTLATDHNWIHFAVSWEDTLFPLLPIHLLLGIPRPQTARKILQAASALGVASMTFFPSDRSDPGYARSTLWATDEWKRHIDDGVAQAFATSRPAVSFANDLQHAIAEHSEVVHRVALDNYEAPFPLNAKAPTPLPMVLAVGAERGWSAVERELLRVHHFALQHLGARIVRMETAVVAAIGRLAPWDEPRYGLVNEAP